MEKQYDIVALGELLVDFTPMGRSPAGMNVFEQNPGGAPANVLVAAARAGLRTAFLGKVGADMHGAFLTKVLQQEGIDTSGIIADDSVFTTLAFVALDEKGNRSFSFARKPGADTMLCAQELKQAVLEQCKVLHVGSLSLTDEPARSTTMEAVRMAKAAGAVISYDPNYRAPLWRSKEDAICEMRMLLPYADIVKISDEETELLTGQADPAAAAQCLNEQGAALAAVTLGPKGALLRVKSGESVCVPTCPVSVVDTTGAGDTFWGGLLTQFIESGKAPKALTLEDAKGFAAYANAAAALCVSARGGIPSIPTKAQTLAFMQENEKA